MALGPARSGCRRCPPPHCILMHRVGCNNDQMGEGHPPPSAARSKGSGIALVSRRPPSSGPEQRLVEAETQGSSDEALSLI